MLHFVIIFEIFFFGSKGFLAKRFRCEHFHITKRVISKFSSHTEPGWIIANAELQADVCNLHFGEDSGDINMTLYTNLGHGRRSIFLL